MGVRDRLPGQAAVRILKDAQEAEIGLKARQFVGASSSRYYETENPGEFDWSGRLSTPSPQMPEQGSMVLLVEASPTDSQVLIADLVPECYTSTDGVTWTRFFYDPSNFASPFYFYWVNEAPAASPTTNRWYVVCSALLNSWIAWKFQVVTDQPVMLTVTRFA